MTRPQPDPFDALGLDPEEATPELVNKAHRRLAREFHPDRGGDATRMASINQARDALSTPSKIDQARRSRSAPDEPRTIWISSDSTSSEQYEPEPEPEPASWASASYNLHEPSYQISAKWNRAALEAVTVVALTTLCTFACILAQAPQLAFICVGAGIWLAYKLARRARVQYARGQTGSRGYGLATLAELISWTALVATIAAFVVWPVLRTSTGFQAAAPKEYASCDKLRKHFPVGVSVNSSSARRARSEGLKRPASGIKARQTYKLNRAKFDRKKRGWACAVRK